MSLMLILPSCCALMGTATAQNLATTFPETSVTKPVTSSQPVTITVTPQSSDSVAHVVLRTNGVDGTVYPQSSEYALSGTESSQNCFGPQLAGQSCTVSVTFNPLYPGIQMGAVLLENNSGQLVGEASISGIGSGGLPFLQPATINTIAGNGDQQYNGAVTGLAAAVFSPYGVVVDGAGNLYFCDAGNNRVRRVDPTNNIITVAGTGTAGSSGDGGPATSAQLSYPTGLAMDGAGNLYIADKNNNVIRRVDAITKNISTITATVGILNEPEGLAITPAGNLIIADSANNVIRMVTPSGTLSTIAGDGTASSQPGNPDSSGQFAQLGDGGAAINAELNKPFGVAVGLAGLAIADLGDQLVRLVTINGNGMISTIAGTGQRGNQTTSTLGPGLALSQDLDSPAAVAFDPAGDLYVADSGNNVVRMVQPSGKIATFAGTGAEADANGNIGDGGADTAASLYGHYGLFFDNTGSLWISDTGHNRVREINGSLYGPLNVGQIKVYSTSTPPIVGALWNLGSTNLKLEAPTLNQTKLDASATTCTQNAMPPVTSCSMGMEFAPTAVPNPEPGYGTITWASDAPNITPLDELEGDVLTVNPTTVTLTANPSPGVLGSPITLTAQVSNGVASLSGTVTFTEGSQSTFCSNVPLNSTGLATCVVQNGLTLGTHTLTATYSGDTDDEPNTGQTTEVVLEQAALSLSTSASPAVVTNNVTLTLVATEPGGGTPIGGTVTFYDGSTQLSAAINLTNGQATYNTQLLAVGSHSLTAQYSGYGNTASGTSNTATMQIVPAATITVLTTNASTPTVGTPLTLTAAVQTSLLGGTSASLSGNVTFTDGSGPGALQLGQVTLVNGTATITIASLAPGAHQIVASYSGDPDDAASTSNPSFVTVEQIATTTALSADANPLNAGATLHLTSIVSLVPGANPDGALGGSVTFLDGAKVLGSAAVNSTGQATLAVPALTVGTHMISASYSGAQNYFPSASGALSVVVQQTITAITLVSSSTSTLAGKPTTFTASVSSSTGTPTGTVTFYDGSTAIGSGVVNSSGVATISTTTLSTGMHSIVASYGGDANYLAARSAPVQQQIVMAQPVVLLSGPATSVYASTVAQFIAALTTPGVSPTGTVTLLDGITVLSTTSVSGDGNFQFSTSSLAVGAHSITAAYSGDSNNAAVVSNPVTVMVKQASTATMLISSVNPLTSGGPITLTASVTSVDNVVPSGQVNFYDGTTLLGTAGLTSTGTAVLLPTGMGLGTHTLTAVYTGDNNHLGSTSASVPELVVQSASITLTSSNNPSASGQNVTFVAQVSGSASKNATGSVSFLDNGSLLATVPLNAQGAGSYMTSSLSVGTHAISVSYSGDSSFSAASAQLTQTVVEAITSVGLSSGENPVPYGQTLNLTAIVTSNGGIATGVVNFMEGGTILGSVRLDATGHAVYPTSALRPGSHTITASYLGDGRADPSNSAPLTIAVLQTTTLSVSAVNNPALALDPVTVTAILENAGAAPASGVVTFTDGVNVIGTASIDATGHAVLPIQHLSVGVHKLAASYPGDSVDFPSSSPIYSEVVQLRPTTTTVTGSATDATNPQQITLIAVIGGQGPTPPTGTVTFTSGSVTLGEASVDSTGVAAITVIFQTTSEPVVASYSGDASYAASNSAATPITAGQAAQFTLNVSNPTITLQTHQHTTLTVALGSVKGFTDTIELGCVGLPYAATCTFGGPQMKLQANGVVTTTLILDTGDPLGAGTGTSASLRSRGSSTLLCFLPAGALLSFVRRRQVRKLKAGVGAMLALIVAVVLTVGSLGCSGLTMSGTPPGTYTFKVMGNGQGSGTTQAQTITLVVTK